MMLKKQDKDLSEKPMKRFLMANEHLPKQIKQILMKGFNRFALKYNYDYCEDSTRVFTIKVKDTVNSRIIYSCDFAVVNNYGDNQQECIRFDKSGHYFWAKQPRGFYQLREKIWFCKENNLWQSVRKCYLQKKNNKDAKE